jgi:dephospho-CoA kinase
MKPNKTAPTNLRFVGDPGAAPPIIAVTGNSGSGKSAVTAILSDYARVIDCDKIAREVLEKNSECYFEVINYFGTDIIDKEGNILRRKLADMIFTSDEKYNALTKTTHKYIIKIIKKIINEIIKENKNKLIVLDIPVLIGTTIHDIVNETWVVYADSQIQIDRIIERDGVSRESAENRLAKQTPVADLLAVADVAIYNSGKTLSSLREEVLEALFRRPRNL